MRPIVTLLAVLILLGFGISASNALDGYGSADEGSATSLPSGQELAETAQVELRQILLVVPPSEYQETEFKVARDHFQSKGFEVAVASEGVAVAKGMDGSQVEVDVNLSDVNVSLYQAVVFIGGMGVDNLVLYEDPDFINIAKRAQAQDMVIAAICFAPQILANADLLQGKNATVSGNLVYYPAPIDRLKDKGAIYLDEQVVRDGKIITGNGISASQPFAEMVVTVINEVAFEETSDETVEEGTVEVATEVVTGIGEVQDR